MDGKDVVVEDRFGADEVHGFVVRFMSFWFAFGLVIWYAIYDSDGPLF